MDEINLPLIANVIEMKANNQQVSQDCIGYLLVGLSWTVHTDCHKSS